jgi:hypothetical protein
MCESLHDSHGQINWPEVLEPSEVSMNAVKDMSLVAGQRRSARRPAGSELPRGMNRSSKINAVYVFAAIA